MGYRRPGRFSIYGDLLEGPGHRHVLDWENADLTKAELRLKYRAAKEGHDEYVAEIAARDLLRRTHSR